MKTRLGRLFEKLKDAIPQGMLVSHLFLDIWDIQASAYFFGKPILDFRVPRYSL